MASQAAADGFAGDTSGDLARLAGMVAMPEVASLPHVALGPGGSVVTLDGGRRARRLV